MKANKKLLEFIKMNQNLFENENIQRKDILYYYKEYQLFITFSKTNNKIYIAVKKDLENDFKELVKNLNILYNSDSFLLKESTEIKDTYLFTINNLSI